MKPSERIRDIERDLNNEVDSHPMGRYQTRDHLLGVAILRYLDEQHEPRLPEDDEPELPDTWGHHPAKVELKGALADILGVSLRTAGTCVNAMCKVKTRNVHTGEPIRVYNHGFKAWPEEPMTDRQLAEHVKAALLDVLEHEISEAIVINGARPLDPHASKEAQ